MKPEKIPSVKRLSMVWFGLILLTLFSMMGARADLVDTHVLSPLLKSFVFILSLFKAQAILLEFMNLRISSAAWKIGFFCMMCALLTLLFLISIF
jgi:hypothetical protein